MANQSTGQSPLFKCNLPAVSEWNSEYYFSNSAKEQAARVFPPHIHDQLEIYVLLDGDASFMVENEIYRLQAGDAVFSRPNEIHNCILNTPSKHKHLCIWFDPTCSFLFSDFLANKTPNHIAPDTPSKERLLVLYQQLLTASEQNDKQAQFYLQLEILDIFRKNLTKGGVAPARDLPTQLKDILRDLNANFAQIQSLQYFTDKYFISQSTLNRLFKRYLHTTPYLYLESKRLAHSRVLLKQGKSVLQACMDSGFPDYSNYIRLFKKRFSVTPKKYRDNLTRS